MADDLMERLTAADPQREADAEPDEALLERLLATRTEHERRPRRWKLAAAATATAAAAAVAATGLIGSSDVVERAVAAVTQEDAVYHVIQIRHVSGDVRGATSSPHYVESWSSSDGRMHEKVSVASGREPGRLLEEIAGRRPGSTITYDPERDMLLGGGFGSAPQGEEVPFLDSHADPAATLRALEERGLLHEDGETRVGGRSAYRLVSDTIRDEYGDEQRFEYVVDAQTYLPLRHRWWMRHGDEELGYASDYLVYERLSVDARSAAQLELDRHPGAECAYGADDASGRELGFPNPCGGRP